MGKIELMVLKSINDEILCTRLKINELVLSKKSQAHIELQKKFLNNKLEELILEQARNN